jgi:putative transposase
MLETELLDHYHIATCAQAKAASFDFIEGFYNTPPASLDLGMLSPNEYECRHTRQTDYAAA